MPTDDDHDLNKMYRLFSVVPRKDKKPLWLNIGTMYPHKKGDGFNIMLQAIPLQTGPGEAKIVARLYEPKADKDDDGDPDVEETAGKSASRK